MTTEPASTPAIDAEGTMVVVVLLYTPAATSTGASESRPEKAAEPTTHWVVPLSTQL